MTDVALIPKKNPKIYTNIDKVYELVEGKGRYKYIVVLCTSISYLTYMLYLFSMPLFLLRPTATCNIDGYWRECTYEEICENEDVSYKFDVGEQFNFRTEFGWYCDDATPALFTATAFFIGTTFSALLLGSLSDAYGRLPVMILGLIGNIFGLTILAMFASPYTCLIATLIIGFFTMANDCVPFNFLADSVQESYRETLPSILNIVWAFGEIALALAMWTGIEWRTMCLINVIYTTTFFIPFLWLRESPRFYLSQNRTREAQASLRNMARINGVDISDIKLRATDSVEKEEVHPTFCSRMQLMCCEATMLKQIVIFSLMLTICNMIFYALSLNLEQMEGNPYLNAIILAIAELVSVTSGGLSLKVTTPKVAICVSFVITAVGVAGLGLFWEDPLWSIVFCIFGKIGSCSVDNLLYTVSGIIFPTAILSGVLSFGLFCTRFGSMLAKPLYLIGPGYMCMLMTVLGVIAAILTLFLKSAKEEKDPDDNVKAINDKP